MPVPPVTGSGILGKCLKACYRSQGLVYPKMINLKVTVVISLYHLFQKESSSCISSEDLDPFLPISMGYLPV